MNFAQPLHLETQDTATTSVASKRMPQVILFFLEFFHKASKQAKEYTYRHS